MRLLLIPLAALSLAACSGGDGDGTSITFNGETENGTATTVSTENGALKVDLPGFKADIAMPKFQLDAGDFDMNGVNLYPGSTITSLNITDGGNDGEGSGGVTVRFAAPAAADVVRTWFGEQLQQAGFKLTQAGNGLSGTTEEGKPFRMELNPAGQTSNGTITIGG